MKTKVYIFDLRIIEECAELGTLIRELETWTEEASQSLEK